MHMLTTRQSCMPSHVVSKVQLLTPSKKLIFTMTMSDFFLHFTFVPSRDNPADAPSRRLSAFDNQLHPDIWSLAQKEFGGLDGHTCDLMYLDSNVMMDLHGSAPPHFTSFPTPASLDVNIFAQNFTSFQTLFNATVRFPLL